MQEGVEGINMLDMNMVNSTISELEHADTTFTNCDKLASLYIIREYHKDSGVQDKVTEELSDILPHYSMYCDKKRDYQLNKVGEDVMIDSLQTVCKEIYEFMQTLYSSTDMIDERAIIISLIDRLQDIK